MSWAWNAAPFFCFLIRGVRGSFSRKFALSRLAPLTPCASPESWRHASAVRRIEGGCPLKIQEFYRVGKGRGRECGSVNERSFIFLFDNERAFILHRFFPVNYEKLNDTFRRVIGFRGGFGVRRRLPDSRAGRRQHGQRHGGGHRQRKQRRLRRVLESVGGVLYAARSRHDAHGLSRLPRPADALRQRQGLDSACPHGA